MDINAWTPTAAAVVIEASTTIANVALTGSSTVGCVLRVANAGSVKAFVGWGASAALAETHAGDDTVDLGVVILPGATEVFAIPPGVTHVAADMDSSTADIHFQRGQGV